MYRYMYLSRIYKCNFTILTFAITACIPKLRTVVWEVHFRKGFLNNS